MTIANTDNSVREAGNGSKTAFDFEFKIYNVTDIKAYKIDTTADPEERTLGVYGVDYTVSISTSAEGGTLTWTVAPTADEDSFIERDLPYTQPTNIPAVGGVRESQLEKAFDKLCILIQQLLKKTQLSLKFVSSSTQEDRTLPEPEEGKTIKWDADGNMVNSDFDPDEAQADSAASAAAAAASESAAASSASSASSSASSASSSAAAAAASAAAAAAEVGLFEMATVSIKTDNYTILSTDFGKAMIMNAGTAKAFTLPAVSASANKILIFKNIGAGLLTLTPNGADTIDRSTLVQNMFAIFVADSSNTKWRLLGIGYNLSGTPVGTDDTQTLSNKRMTPRIGTTASSSTPTPDADANDQYNVTALAAGATFGAPTGTPVDGQTLIIRVKDNGTARSLAFNAIYRAIGITLPTTTVVSKTLYLGMRYNAADVKWDVIAYQIEG